MWNNFYKVKILIFTGLRRMNMRSIVGHKDVFLSYAHININFARRLKVRWIW